MTDGLNNPTQPNWKAIAALAVGVAGLIIAEFLPAGVLTLMSVDLGISEGTAGQAVTMTSVFAVATSLLIAYMTRKFDRRKVILWLSFLLACSSVIVAYAPGFPSLLCGRVLLGVSLGGFWSMSLHENLEFRTGKSRRPSLVRA